MEIYQCMHSKLGNSHNSLSHYFYIYLTHSQKEQIMETIIKFKCLGLTSLN
jgi:hypothetical protein